MGLARRTFLIGILAAMALVAALWMEHRSELTIPAPEGPYAVGRTVYDWASGSREMLAWIWYPAANEKSSGVTQDYLPPELRSPNRLRGPVILRPLAWLFQLTEHEVGSIREHSIRDAQVSSREPSYPVIVMRGGAWGEVARYSILAEDLASRGYIVVGFDVPYRTSEVVFPDGRVIQGAPENNPEAADGPDLTRLAMRLAQEWSADMTLAVNQLAGLNAHDPSGRFQGHVDLKRVGAFGHSLGGAESLQFCHDDVRCTACLDLDGGLWGTFVQDGIKQPVMFLMSDHTGESDPEGVGIQADIQSILRRAAGRSWLMMIRGGNHFMFTDDALLRSRMVVWLLLKLHILKLDGPRQIEIAKYGIHTFFDAYLKGAGGTPPQLLSPQYPELQPLQ